MCKKLRDILFPTNVLGKDKRTIKFSLKNKSISLHRILLDIQFVGKRLEICYTQVTNYNNYQEKSVAYENGDGTSILLDIHPYDRDGQYGDIIRNGALGDMIYLKCTDVTSLIIDWQQII